MEFLYQLFERGRLVEYWAGHYCDGIYAEGNCLLHLIIVDIRKCIYLNCIFLQGFHVVVAELLPNAEVRRCASHI